MAIDKTEYLKALTAERETLSAKLTEIEFRLDEIDAEICRNTEPPDVSKMTPLQRAVYEDSLLLRRHIAQKIAKASPFVTILDGGVFPKGL